MSGISTPPSQIQPINEHNYPRTIFEEPGVFTPAKDPQNDVENVKKEPNLVVPYKDLFKIKKERKKHRVSSLITRPTLSDSKGSLESFKKDPSFPLLRQSPLEDHESDSSESTIPFEDKKMQDFETVDITDTDEEAEANIMNLEEHGLTYSVGETVSAEMCVSQDAVEVELTIESLSPQEVVEPPRELAFDLGACVEDIDKDLTGRANPKEASEHSNCEDKMDQSEIVADTSLLENTGKTSPAQMDSNQQEGASAADNQRSDFTSIREPEARQITAAAEFDLKQAFIDTIAGQHISLTVPFEYLKQEEKQLREAASRNKTKAFPLDHKRKNICKEREYHKETLATRQADLYKKSKALEETVELLGSNSCEIFKLNEERSKLIAAIGEAKVKILEFKIALNGVQGEIFKDQLQLEVNPGDESLLQKIAEMEEVSAKYFDEITAHEKLKQDRTNAEQLLADKMKKRSSEEVALRRKIEELEVQHQGSQKLVEEAQRKFNDATRRLIELDKQYKIAIVQFMMLETRMVAVQACRKQKELQERILRALEDLCERRGTGPNFQAG